MQFLGRFLGVAKQTELKIKLNKEQYHPGDRVSGTILLHTTEEIQDPVITIKWVGRESVEWGEMHSQIAGDDVESNENFFDENNQFFKGSDIIKPKEQLLFTGDYSYPFEFQLPSDLPGEFEANNTDINFYNITTLKAKIAYTVKATLSVNGLLVQDLTQIQSLAIVDNVMDSLKPSTASMLLTSRFCCFARGTCSVNVQLDKVAYCAGDTVKLLVQIQNNTRHDIDKLQCQLIRKISLNANGRLKKLEHVSWQTVFHGTRAGETFSELLPFTLFGDDLYPSTCGRYLRCDYHLHLVASLIESSDLELELPLVLLSAKPNLEQKYSSVALSA